MKQNIYEFNKETTKNKRIFNCDTIENFYLIAFILEQNNLSDLSLLKGKIKILSRNEIKYTDINGNELTYIFNKKDNTITVYSR